MLSYRHGYHAGNHADVLKHVTQVLCLQHLLQKDKPIVYIDTHAGAGSYDLQGPWAQKNAEFSSGIELIWSASKLPPGLADLKAVVQQVNPKGGFRYYPGSPQLAATLLRADDRLRLVEQHSTEAEQVRKRYGRDRRIKIIEGDGFDQIKALLPPQPRRGMILIDPSYEMARDYQRTLIAVKEGLERFATGMFLIWYPALRSVDAREFPARLRKLPTDSWLDVSLQVRSPAGERGMYGSGMFVINPPWTLQAHFETMRETLVKLLGQDETAQLTLTAS